MKAIILSIILIFPLMAMSDTGRPGVLTDENGNPIERSFGTPADSGTSDSGTTIDDGGLDSNIDDTSGFQDTQSGAESNAQQSESSSDMTKMLGMMMGAAFAAMCGPKNPAACVMSALSFIDALASAGNQGNSVNFGNSLLPGGGPGDTTNEDAPTDPVAQEAQAQLAALESMGYISNADGSVTTPNGETFSGSDFGSAESLQNKGLNPGQAQAAMDLLKSTQDKAQADLAKEGGRAIASVGGDSAGGGGGGLQPLPDLIIDEGGGAAAGGLKSSKVGRMPASEASKLSKNFNGTPIGISLGDIFLIVEQKYDDKEQQQAFINKEY